ncbi:YafY family protein [Cryobacterium sp. N21]|uniref:helix-turn-helix transcriptional regulator n=1 Tax=Cryobacterium sp. N21 TaxID=2048289 RepID=UPI000CE2EBA7|nr:WYL domain-containing protein [Cryobacterium sp. N21]
MNVMWDTSGRLLRLLALLQRTREWNAAELAVELEVTARTVRRDVARLRDLGYPVASIHGIGGGYQLEAGTTLPPLMFDAEEAIATLLALQDASATGNRGAAPGALSALDKLNRVMPPRLRSTIDALAENSSRIDLGSQIGSDPVPVNTNTLVLLARACRDRRQIEVTYKGHAGSSNRRYLEPLHLVRTMNRWHLVAFSLDANDWRIFRVDRLEDATITTASSRPRKPPAEDLDLYVAGRVGAAVRQVTATVRVHAPRAEVAHWISAAWGTITEETAETSILQAGADSYNAIARWLLLINRPLTVVDPPALRAAFATIATEAKRTASKEATGGSAAK